MQPDTTPGCKCRVLSPRECPPHGGQDRKGCPVHDAALTKPDPTPDLDAIERLAEHAIQSGGDEGRIGVGVSVSAVRWLLRAARERDELRSPLWTCVGCGRVERDGWKSQKYEAGDEDIVCPECGSTDVREHPREVLTQVISERDELRAERDAARIALGGHATGDFASDDGCGCTMLGLVRLCETHHDWLKQGQAEIKELRARAEKAEADLAESKRLAEKAEARAKELEALVKKWPSLECPCCGEEGAMALFFEDGQETTCGCGGRVSADGENASISIDDSEDECPKCAVLAQKGPEPE